MNQAASAPGVSLVPDSTHLFTAANLALIAVLALVVIAGLIWGMRLSRRRHQAAREIKAHNRTIETGGAAAARGDGDDRRQPTPPAAAAPAPPVAGDTTREPTELLFGKLPDAQNEQFAPPTRRPMPKPLFKSAPSWPTGAPTPAEPVTEVLPARTPPPATPSPPPPPPAPPTPPAPPAVADPAHAEGPVTQLKGLGPKLAAKLAEHGITTVGDLAALTDDEAQALDARLGPFTGRMSRDRWQEQARFLAAGDRAGFEAVFGRL